MWTARQAAVLVLGLVLLVQAGQIGDLAPYVIGGVLVAGHIGTIVFLKAHRRPGMGGPGAVVGVLAICWLVLAILPTHDFAHRSSAAATTTTGLQPLLELIVFTAAFGVALAVIRNLEPNFERARPPAVLTLYPVWAFASMFWSEAPLYAMVRAWQLGVIATMAWATVALGRARPEALDSLVQIVLRWFVRTAMVLTAMGYAFGPIYVSISPSNRGRFTWIGAHPNGSGLVIAAAIVIVLATSARDLRLPPLVRWGCLGVLIYAMYDNHSRAAWLCLGVGCLAVFTLKGRLVPFLRWSGTPLLAACAVAAVYFRGDEIWDYVLRDRSQENLSTGSGRRDLWTVGLRSLDTAFDWVCGHGYGITRTLFQGEVTWNAGEAHNSLLAVLVGTGLIGVLVIGAVWAQTLYNLMSLQMWRHSRYGIALTALVVLVFVDGMAIDVWAEPTIGFALLYLVASAALVHRSRAHSDADRPYLREMRPS